MAIDVPRARYAQVADLLRGRIADRTYPPGAALPSEDRLAAELGVSRVTVNRAVGLLRASGDVKVRRGVGTVVRSALRIVRDAPARARGLGVELRTEYLEIGSVVPPAVVAGVLGPGRVLVRRRVLHAVGEPTQTADSYYPWAFAEFAPELLDEDCGVGGSYGRLAEIGHGPARFSEDVTVRVPSEAERRLLELGATQAVFQIWHVAYAAAGQPVEVCVHVAPGHLWTLRYSWADPGGGS